MYRNKGEFKPFYVICFHCSCHGVDEMGWNGISAALHCTGAAAASLATLETIACVVTHIYSSLSSKQEPPTPNSWHHNHARMAWNIPCPLSMFQELENWLVWSFKVYRVHPSALCTLLSFSSPAADFEVFHYSCAACFINHLGNRGPKGSSYWVFCFGTLCSIHGAGYVWTGAWVISFSQLQRWWNKPITTWL